MSASRLAHHFTVDVEEYFQVCALEPHVARSDWERFESRVARGVTRLLDLLTRYEARGTFFVLGWVAERQPALIRLIVRAGHEIASHGWDHVRVTGQTPREFRESTRRSKRVLEDVAGVPVVGYRAPSFSIVPGREWALDILIEEGYRYDSSLFPVRRPGYGYPGGLPDPHWLECSSGRLVEVPPATWRWCGLKFPAGGGGYFRLLPYSLTRAALRQCEQRRQAGTFYIHPWEVDPAQPRFRLPWLTHVRHYGGLQRTETRLERLLAEFRFTAIEGTVALLTNDLGRVDAHELPAL